MALSNSGRQAKAAYMRDYRDKNRDRLNEQRRKWYRENAEKVKEKQDKYWERVAERGAKNE